MSGSAGGHGLVGIIVISYGPRATTRGLTKAHSRLAEQLGIPCHVVSALGDGDPVPRLRSTLRRIEPGPVLWVHDDVTVDHTSVARLVSVHASAGGVTVPMTNERGVENFHGSLPSASTARPQLKRLAREIIDSDVAGSPIARIRTSCMVADRSTLEDLLTHRIHDPFVVVADRGVGLSVVDGAFAAHDGVCGQQVRSSQRDDTRPLLVASMIVRDEEDQLPECLASIDGIVDRVELVDTGSTDRTVEIAEAAGCSVSRFDWNDDFGAARTFAADRCRDARFTLWIDADERLCVSDTELLRDVLATSHGQVDALDVMLHNRNHGPDALPSSSFRARRIVDAELLAFAGRIHETPVRRDDPETPLVTTTFDLATIDHFGYAEDIIAGRDKYRRNVELARAQLDEVSDANPDVVDIKASLDLARSLMLGDGVGTDEAIDLLRSAVDHAGDARSDWRAYLLGALAQILLERGSAAEAYDLAVEGFHLLPTDDLVCAVLASAADELGRHADLVALAATPIPADLPEPVFVSADNRQTFDDLVIVAMAATGDPDSAWESVCGWLAEGPLSSRRTASLVDVAARRFESIDLVEQLLLVAFNAAEPDELVAVAARRLTPELTGLFALGVLDGGRAGADTVTAGALAASVAGRPDILDAVLAHAELLDVSARTALADRLGQRGHGDVADRLRPQSGSSSSLIARLGGGQ